MGLEQNAQYIKYLEFKWQLCARSTNLSISVFRTREMTTIITLHPLYYRDDNNHSILRLYRLPEIAETLSPHGNNEAFDDKQGHRPKQVTCLQHDQHYYRLSGAK